MYGARRFTIDNEISIMFATHQDCLRIKKEADNCYLVQAHSVGGWATIESAKTLAEAETFLLGAINTILTTQ
jgi:predicted RNase H-like HicB family nuclease